MKGGKGAAAAVVLLVFYGSILTIMCVSGSQILSSIQEQAKKLPGIYSQTIEPGLSHFFSLLENSFPGHSIHISALDKAWNVSWKMLLWASPPDCLGGAPLP